MGKDKFITIIHILHQQRKAWQLKAAEAALATFALRRIFDGWAQEADISPKLVSSSEEEGGPYVRRNETPSETDDEDSDGAATFTCSDLERRFILGQLVSYLRR